MHHLQSHEMQSVPKRSLGSGRERGDRLQVLNPFTFEELFTLTPLAPLMPFTT
jgi:hypothetical protein